MLAVESRNLSSLYFGQIVRHDFVAFEVLLTISSLEVGVNEKYFFDDLYVFLLDAFYLLVANSIVHRPKRFQVVAFFVVSDDVSVRVKLIEVIV